ncbi:ABC transporter permease [Aestuariivirga sp. YIM B02566]|uniref:ABC transporter permease n=1 Tax=Taklimakanibacter albus TaxID=2800327 RepID=A0ACC5RF05_9HYPH|nr:ABC transporter permease [Aestuariivirga sp. YIM B02566]MBK1871174.1 ABC transporter permease [Aestuariivirga sp. YIM B02566]
MTNIWTKLRAQPWIWSFIAMIAVWLATIAFTGGQGAGEILTAALSFATFTIIIGLGQMMVITTGPGNVDLSIPATITLAGVVATKVMDTDNARLLIGILAALGASFVVGLFNYGLIRLLRIPPIIATLSSSFLILSTAISYGRGIRIKPPPMLADFATTRILGVPLLAIFVLALSIGIALLIKRTLYGRTVLAIGQNPRAARLAGLNVDLTRFATYLLSALLAGVTGIVLSGFSGGAALNMGEGFLLASIAVVVIGGTSVAGGRANVPGIWGAALFIYLLDTMLNTFGASAGIRLIMTGVIIIAVITIAGGDRQQR